MTGHERQKIILDYLKEHEYATAKDFISLTDASLATIRRDLVQLDKNKLITKSYGSVRLKSQEELSLINYQKFAEDPYLYNKKAIALKAKELIKEGDIIFLGSGMTCNLLANAIKNYSNITVVTTNINAVNELAFVGSKISLLLLGGCVNIGKNYLETLDEYTIDSLEKLYFDKVFFTTDGVMLEYGYSINNRLQLLLYHYLLQNSKDVYLLLNTQKFDKRAFAHLGDMDTFQHILTNNDIPDKYLSYYREHDIDCVLC